MGEYKFYRTGRLGLSILMMALMASCSSILQFQDAAPLGKGVGEVMGGFGAGYYPDTLESNNYGFPFTASFRFGVGPRTDVGIRYSLADDVELSFKQNLIDSRLFLFSAGLQAGMDDLFSSDRKPYVGVPLFIQFRFGDAFSLYGIPAVSTGRFGSDIGLSANAGISFGRWRDKFYIEAGVADYKGLGSTIKTLGLGFAHRF